MRLDRYRIYQIKALLDAGHSQKTVASQLGISPGGLSRELKRNGGREKYDPDKADRRAEWLQRKAHVHYRYSDEVWAETVAMIRDDLSPEQIVGTRGEREHERADTAVPAERDVLRGPDQGTGEADRVETEQQAEKEAWILDTARVYFHAS